MMCDFKTDFEYSLGARQETDIELIKQTIPNCIDVQIAPRELDLKGIDYIAVLDGGAKIFIDAKTRRRGKAEIDDETKSPLLAIETWSYVYYDSGKRKVGWTFNREADTDMILYKFDKDDWDRFYLVPFQHLRMASQTHFYEWREKWKPRKQDNGKYYSEAMFVPASVVLSAVADEMTGAIYG